MYTICKWDEQKNLLNETKHGVKFSLVKVVFQDPPARLIRDDYSSFNEVRYIIIGVTKSEKYYFW